MMFAWGNGLHIVSEILSVTIEEFLKYNTTPMPYPLIENTLRDQSLQQVHNAVTRSADVSRPVLRRCLDPHDPILKHTFIISALL